MVFYPSAITAFIYVSKVLKMQFPGKFRLRKPQMLLYTSRSTRLAQFNYYYLHWFTKFHHPFPKHKSHKYTLYYTVYQHFIILYSLIKYKIIRCLVLFVEFCLYKHCYRLSKEFKIISSIDWPYSEIEGSIICHVFSLVCQLFFYEIMWLIDSLTLTFNFCIVHLMKTTQWALIFGKILHFSILLKWLKPKQYSVYPNNSFRNVWLFWIR